MNRNLSIIIAVIGIILFIPIGVHLAYKGHCFGYMNIGMGVVSLIPFFTTTLEKSPKLKPVMWTISTFIGLSAAAYSACIAGMFD